jgi:hypothetical protein
VKITIITDEAGKLVATLQGHSLSTKQGNFEAGVVLRPGQKAHKVEVDDALAELAGKPEFHDKVRCHIPAA